MGLASSAPAAAPLPGIPSPGRGSKTVVLLGGLESGRQTLAKQFRVLTGAAEPEEIFDTKALLQRNCLASLQATLRAAQQLGKVYEDIIQRAEAREVLQLDPAHAGELSDEQVALCERAMAARSFRETALQRTDYWFPQNGDYVLDKFSDFMDPEYKVTEADYVRAYDPVQHMMVLTLQHLGRLLRIVIPNGNRSQQVERLKRLERMGKVDCIVFLAGLTDHCSVLKDDINTFKIHESLGLFRDVCQFEPLSDVPIILAMNKRDELPELLPRFPLNGVFPEYSGDTSVPAAVEFLRELYRVQFVVACDAPNRKLMTTTMAAVSQEDTLSLLRNIFTVVGYRARRLRVDSGRGALPRVRGHPAFGRTHTTMFTADDEETTVLGHGT